MANSLAGYIALLWQLASFAKLGRSIKSAVLYFTLGLEDHQANFFHGKIFNMIMEIHKTTSIT